MRIAGMNYCPDTSIISRPHNTSLTGYNSFQSGLNRVLQDNNDDEKLREACQEMESILLYEVIRAMRATVPRSEFFGYSYGKEVFESMLDEEYARSMAKSGSTGLAELLFRQLRPR